MLKSKRKAAAKSLVIITAIVLPLTLTIIMNSVPVEALSREEWLGYAQTAWNYFNSSVGVNSDTGLSYSSEYYHFITDWDLGTYILAILDAETIGLLQSGGDWGADYRVDKVLSFLEERRLTDSDIPYLWYSSDYGSSVVERGPTNPSDSGRLLIALHLLRERKIHLSSRIDSIVARSNYWKIAEDCHTNGFYAYYIAHGFSLFGFNTSRVLEALSFVDRIQNMEHVSVYNQSLPATEITSEPILHAIFDLRLGPPFREWADRVYRVQEERYLAEGKLTAFSEGALTMEPWYLYEWIVLSSDKIWYVSSISGEPYTGSPVVFVKAALGMHAVWPSSYTAKLVKYVLTARTSNGFFEGVDESGRVIRILTDKTNALVINAARYALESQPKRYTLKIRSMDWELKEPIANLNVQIDGEAMTTDSGGYVELGNLSGTVTIRVSYMGILVNNPIDIDVDADKEVSVQCRFYDLYVRAMTGDGKPVQNVRFTFSLSGKVLGSATTNQTGYAYIKDLPATNLTLAAYGGADYNTGLGEWVEEISTDKQVISTAVNMGDLEPKDDFRTNLSIIIILAGAFSIVFLLIRRERELKRLAPSPHARETLLMDS